MKKLFFLSAIIFGLSGCVKEKFDSPPAGGEDPIGVVANTTIKQLRSLYPIGSATPIKIDQDWVISGIVNADDKDGNLYKVVTIQDSTAGIQIKIDNSSLYTVASRLRKPTANDTVIRSKYSWGVSFC